MRRHAALALAFSIVGVSAGREDAAATAAEERPLRTAPRIVNGVTTSDYPTAGAVLEGSSPSTARLVCSGILIGCETFLTAAHCVCYTSGPDCQGADATSPDDYFVFLQHAGLFRVSRISVHPDYNVAEDASGDLAVLRLAAPVTGIAPARINGARSPAFGTPGTIVGFGRTGGGPSNTDVGLKRVGRVVTASCPDAASDITSVCWKFMLPLGPPGSNSNTCNGDSGGPLFIDLGSGEVVAGVTSGGTSESCLPVDNSFDANVFHYYRWIRERGGADLDHTACGVIPQVGQPGTDVVAFEGDLRAFGGQARHDFFVGPGRSVLRVAMNAVDDGTADFDLYVRAGSAPSRSRFDCRTRASGQFAACEFPAPAPGAWHVLVHRAKGSGGYQLTATGFGADCSDPGHDGAACEDGNPCTTNDTCQGGTCAGTALRPLAGCQQRFDGRKGLFTLRENAPRTKDRLAWSWLRGTAISKPDFGDPLRTTDYALCIYDGRSGEADLVLGKRIPAAATCGGKPCWKEEPGGFRYRDFRASAGGIKSMLLRAGPDGAAKLIVKGAGAKLGVPALPLRQQDTVTVQLSNDMKCWEARYSTNVTNRAGEFRARPD